METKSRATVYIDLNILEENLRNIRKRFTGSMRILCVVKADAYGHGANKVAGKLESIGADYLGVATVDEGIELRRSGIRLPILVMSGLFPWDDLNRILEANLVPVVYDMNALQRIAEESEAKGKNIKIHIKVDTGMGRLGFMPSDIPAVADLLKRSKNIAVEGLMSHFSSSEIRDEFGAGQVETFKKVISGLENYGIRPELKHMANSGAIAVYPESYFDMVRLGISLYGSNTASDPKDRLPVRQVMKLVSKIALIRSYEEGYPISYGRTFTTKRRMKIACIPVGYSDGYPRALSNKGNVLVREKRCSITGRICMDWLMVDISDIENASAGEEVILLGGGMYDSITADEIAEHSGTIPYEILCKISKRIPRVYV